MLWGPYEPQHYLWEVWECIRRLLTGGLAPLLFPFRPVLQIALSLTIALASLKLYVTYKPFSVAADDRLAELLCWILVLTQLAVLVLSLIHISEPTRRTPISYAVFCLKKKRV